MAAPDVLTHFRSPAPGRAATFGRERELAELTRALDAAAGCDGRLVLVSGEPGIGKTRVADAIADIARDRGARVVWGRCWESGGAPAHWPWVQIVRSLTDDLDDDQLSGALGRDASGVLALSPALRARLPGHEPAPPGDADTDGARFAAWDATASFLGRIAGERPLVIVLDDAHAADLPSLLFLRFLARHLHGRPLLILVTARDAEARANAELFDDLVREGVRLPLRGLTERELALLVTASAGQAPPSAFVRELHRVTDGNPFFALEALRLRLAEAPEQPFALPVALPGGVVDALRRRLDPLPADVCELLAVAAVSGREIEPERVAALADVDPRRVHEALAAGTAAGLVEPWPRGHRFTHALVRDALYETIEDARRAAMHERLARALEGSAAVAELAHHYAAAGSPETLRYARAAGDEAAATLAFEAAALHYEQALARAPEGAEECDLLLALAEALMRSGDTAAARARFREAADRSREHGEPARFAAAALGFGSGGEMWANGGVDEALVALLEESLERLPASALATRALVLARLSDVLLYAHDWERTGRVSDSAVAAARKSGEPVALMRALEARLLALLRPATYDERASIAAELERLADESGNPERILAACTWQMSFALERGDRAAVDSHLARFVAIAEQQRQPSMLWGARLHEATVALLDGSIDEAERLAHEALAVGESAVPLSTQMFGVQILGIRRAQGRLAELEPGLRAMVKAFPSVAGWRVTWASVLLQTGHQEEARRELETIARADFLISPDDYEWLPSMAGAAEAFARLGDRESCATLYERLLPYAHLHIVVSIGVAYGGSVEVPLGVLAAALGEREAAERHFARAQTAHAAMGVGSHAQRAQPSGLVFVRDGDHWTIGEEATPLRLRDAKGLRHIAELLARPGAEVAALDLAGGSPTGDAGPALDPVAKSAYRERIADLEADLDEARRFNDPERAESLRAELKAVAGELSAATGLNGRDRHAKSASERARTTVTKAIRTSIARIADHDPELADYLTRSIRTGTYCSYEPPAHGRLDWRVTS